MVGRLGIVLALLLAAPADSGSATGYAVSSAQSRLPQSQARAVGYVRSRNGVGLSGCQLDFSTAQGNLAYRVHTDQRGAFAIDSPRNGSYSLTILQGGRSHQTRVTINGGAISPNTLVVPW